MHKARDGQPKLDQSAVSKVTYGISQAPSVFLCCINNVDFCLVNVFIIFVIMISLNLQQRNELLTIWREMTRTHPPMSCVIGCLLLASQFPSALTSFISSVVKQLNPILTRLDLFGFVKPKLCNFATRSLFNSFCETGL